MRRATFELLKFLDTARDFYPRSPCGERHPQQYNFDLHFAISIHALLAESDAFAADDLNVHSNFYPRSPCGERPRQALHIIHTARNFYPRSPCGERLPAMQMLISQLAFLSTLSLRRATLERVCVSNAIEHFYPRSPCGERLAALHIIQRSIDISIHALLAESDRTG